MSHYGLRTSAVDSEGNQRNGDKYILRLFVSGMTRSSTKAVDNIKKICEEKLQGRYDFEVIDIYQKPEYAAKENLLAAPTLIKQLPLPIRRFIGDMSDKERILIGLNLFPEKEQAD